MERRVLLRGLAVATIVASSSVSACTSVTYEEDTWGNKLIKFLRDGRENDLDGLFQASSTLVSFEPAYVSADKLAFAGEREVRGALVEFRDNLMSIGWSKPRALIQAKIVGSEQQGRMNRIELLFADKVTTDTSCGPDRAAWRVDLYYKAWVYEAGEDWVKWAIERVALMPPLEIVKA